MSARRAGTALISLEEKAGDARQKLDATRAKHRSDVASVEQTGFDEHLLRTTRAVSAQ